jgi:hypothetical protein
MYALERLVFQGTERCPQYRWKQFAVCANEELLIKVKNGQRRPEDWRVSPLADAVEERRSKIA